MAYVEVNIEIRCPHCNRSRWIDADALVGSGAVPQNSVACGGCGGSYTVEIDIDVAIIPGEPGGDDERD